MVFRTRLLLNELEARDNPSGIEPIDPNGPPPPPPVEPIVEFPEPFPVVPPGGGDW